MAKKVEFNMDMVKKYIFWACTPIGLVVAVLAGWMAIVSIASDLERQKQQLESQRSSISQLADRATAHPNQGTIDAINEKREELAANVLSAWEILEREQRAQNRWTGLADVAIREIESRNFLDPLSSTTLNSYLHFARDEMNKLLEQSNIRRVEPRRPQQGEQEVEWIPIEPISLTEGRGGTGGISGSGGRFDRTQTQTTSTPTMIAPNAQLRGRVVWNNPMLDITMQDWGRQPQPFEVWLTQEDIWVYQALLWVIAKSNENVRENGIPLMQGVAGSSMGRNAPSLDLSGSVVKEIIELAIGQGAATELQGQSSRRLSAGGLGGDGMMGMGGGDSFFGGGMGMGMGMGDSDGGMMGGAAMAEQARQAAMMGRYVDADGNPLMEPDFTGQFRRMPVYLKLRVDQRYISDILVNCANSPMPIDVMWVTVNPSATQSFEFASATGMGTSFDGGGFSARGGGGGGGASGRFSGAGAGGTQTTGGIDFGPNEVIIEIFGCINIFSPPDPRTIGGDTGMAGSGGF